MAPLWFKKYRSNLFVIYMALTSALFFIYYNNVDIIQRTDDPNRITNLKTALELEDLDFIQMVDDLKIQLNEVDLRDVEK